MAAEPVSISSFGRRRISRGMHLQARPFARDPLARLLDGNVGVLLAIQPKSLRRDPAHRIGDDPLHERMMINWIQLLAETEVENLPFAATQAATAAKHFSALEPGDEHL